MLTTVQDLGRWGLQASGVPVAGPMDVYSHALANRLVGNDASAAAIEITLMGPELESHEEIVCAVAGAAFDLTIGSRQAPMHEPFVVRSGERLRFGVRRSGARATLAVGGGIAVAPVFGSRATSLVSRMGPFEGRALRAGDVLPVGASQPAAALSASSHASPLQLPHGGARLRVMAGPQEHLFPRIAYDSLVASRFEITPSSNRMGYRLEGPSLPSLRSDILSDATPVGSIQVPASGQPILLMADRQTTGGYPKIATVISADLPLAGQLAPGDWIEFQLCTRDVAVDALRTLRSALEGRA
jgi:antagonist of KipI